MKTNKHLWSNLAQSLLESDFFFFFADRAVYKVMWKNTVQPDRPQMTIWHVRIACCITNTNKHPRNTLYLLLSTATMVAWTRLSAKLYVHSCQQKSIGLKFSKSQIGNDVRYSCHHNSSRFTFPIFAHSCRFSVLHSLQSITPRIY